MGFYSFKIWHSDKLSQEIAAVTLSNKVPEHSTNLCVSLRSELFSGSNTGINFEKYDDIPVEATGQNCPQHIESVSYSHYIRYQLHYCFSSLFLYMFLCLWSHSSKTWTWVRLSWVTLLWAATPDPLLSRNTPFLLLNQRETSWPAHRQVAHKHNKVLELGRWDEKQKWMRLSSCVSGSGKTAAFLLPVLSQIYTDGPGEALNAAKASGQVKERKINII